MSMAVSGDDYCSSAQLPPSSFQPPTRRPTSGAVRTTTAGRPSYPAGPPSYLDEHGSFRGRLLLVGPAPPEFLSAPDPSADQRSCADDYFSSAQLPPSSFQPPTRRPTSGAVRTTTARRPSFPLSSFQPPTRRPTSGAVRDDYCSSAQLPPSSFQPPTRRPTSGAVRTTTARRPSSPRVPFSPRPVGRPAELCGRLLLVGPALSG